MTESVLTDTPAPKWAKVELMGRRVHCGLTQEVERFVAKLLLIDLFPTGQEKPLLTEYYGGSSVFNFTPCTEALTRKWADDRWNLPVEARLALPAPIADAEIEPWDVSDDDEDDAP